MHKIYEEEFKILQETVHIGTITQEIFLPNKNPLVRAQYKIFRLKMNCSFRSNIKNIEKFLLKF